MEKVSYFETVKLLLQDFNCVAFCFNLDVAASDSNGQDKPDRKVSSLIPVLPVWSVSLPFLLLSLVPLYPLPFSNPHLLFKSYKTQCCLAI